MTGVGTVADVLGAVEADVPGVVAVVAEAVQAVADALVVAADGTRLSVFQLSRLR
jgi:hypothetical protein